MTDYAIDIRGLSKKYRLGVFGYGSLQKDLVSFWARLRGKEDPNAPLLGADRARERGGEFWALDDVSFAVPEGEVLGIIGRNGAGKSTLLKILSGITAPTKGEITLHGRLASLLEVGTGFHPELTGRENVYINGAILGMTKREIARKFDEIVDFSGVEQFIDTPVKRYSSGMYVRLAFAVAAHLEAEILLVDEVLAVGDAEFQKKCLGKMGEVARGGRTVLFVSHQLNAVSNLCGKVVLLKDGQVAFLGPTADGLNAYREQMSVKQSPALSGSSQPNTLFNYHLRTSLPNNIQEWGAPMHIEFDIRLDSPASIEMDVLFVYSDFNRTALCIYYDFEREITQSGVYHILCKIPKVRLYMGQYTITLLVQNRFSKVIIAREEYILGFDVVMDSCRLKATPWYPDELRYIEDSDWKIDKQ